MAAVLVAIMAMALTAGAAWAAITPVDGPTFTYSGSDATTNGKIEITNATKEKQYDLYKIFDATYNADGDISYTVKAGDLKTELATSGTDYFTIGATADKNGNYSVTRAGTTTDGTFTPTKTDAQLIAYLKTLKDKFTEIGGITAKADGTITFNKIPYGYYFIDTTSGSNVTIDSNSPTASVIDKNQTPSFDKNIVENSTEVKVNEASTAEDVSFKIALDAKNYHGEDKVFKYVVYDTLDAGWTLKDAPVVKIAGTTKAAITDYTITYKKAANGDTTTNIAEAQYFEISIPWTSDGTKDGTHLYGANTSVEVTYTAYLDAANKASGINSGSTANKNTADVKYYKGSDTPSGTPSGDLPDKETETYTTSLTINKVDGDSKALQGAEFTLTTDDGATVLITTANSFAEDEDGTYYLLNDGTYTTEAPTGDETHDATYADTSKKYKATTTVTAVGQGRTTTTLTGTVDDEGKITFTGLGAGTYKLAETVVPAGYNRAADIDFTITFDANEKVNDEANANYKKFASSNTAIALDSTNNVFETTVVNNAGTELPSTGGMGTTVLYVIGAILVIGAGVFLVARRRANKEQDEQ